MFLCLFLMQNASLNSVFRALSSSLVQPVAQSRAYHHDVLYSHTHYKLRQHIILKIQTFIITIFYADNIRYSYYVQCMSFLSDEKSIANNRSKKVS